MRYSRIFLIDDDEDDQELFLLALGQIDPTIECIIHPDGRAAIKALRGSVDAPDLIVLDLNMPRMTGQQFLAALDQTKASKKIPVIVLSTSSDPASIDETRSLGAERFITKPSNFKELKNILQQIFV
jgi:CheY-like chemotaxis protein